MAFLYEKLFSYSHFVIPLRLYFLLNFFLNSADFASSGKSSIDLAKDIFQLHGTDANGKHVLKKRFTREKLTEYVANLKPFHCTDTFEKMKEKEKAYQARKSTQPTGRPGL